MVRNVDLAWRGRMQETHGYGDTSASLLVGRPRERRDLSLCWRTVPYFQRELA